MASQAARTYTYDDLLAFPEAISPRREVIDGELVVTGSPILYHQRSVTNLVGALFIYCQRHGGEVLTGPLDHYISHTNVLVPDLVYFSETNPGRQGQKNVSLPPDIVVEISSPSTRRRDLGRKKELYAEFGVAEYWFVDLDHGRVLIHRLEDGYADPRVLDRDGVLTSHLLPGFELAIEALLGPHP